MNRIDMTDFRADIDAIVRAATAAPVLITCGQRDSHVLMSIADYRRLAGLADSDGSGADEQVCSRFLSGLP